MKTLLVVVLLITYFVLSNGHSAKQKKSNFIKVKKPIHNCNLSSILQRLLTCVSYNSFYHINLIMDRPTNSGKEVKGF